VKLSGNTSSLDAFTEFPPRVGPRLVLFYAVRELTESEVGYPEKWLSPDWNRCRPGGVLDFIS
jgi:hypothetical protein